MSRAHPGAEERDRGLARARKVTVATAVMATALAGATAGVAAMTLPGRSTTGGASPSTPQGDGGAQQSQQQDGLQLPDQAPQAPSNQGPLVITGSS